MTAGHTQVSRDEFERHPGRYLDAARRGDAVTIASGEEGFVIVPLASAPLEPEAAEAYRAAIRKGLEDQAAGRVRDFEEYEREHPL